MISRKTSVSLTLALGVTVAAVIGVYAFMVLPSIGGAVPHNVPGKITMQHSPMSDVLAVLSILVAMTALPGTVTYLLTRRDFRSRGAALATTGCVILVGAGSWVGFVFPFFAFFVAAAVYLVMRRLVRVGLALTVSAVTLVGGIVCSVLTMIGILNYM